MSYLDSIATQYGLDPDSYRNGTAGVKLGMVNELRAAGMSDNAIRGILANANDESGFNPSLRHADQPRWGGEAHFAHGLYQEGGQEWNNYDAWRQRNYPEAPWQDAQLQTRFLAQNLKDNYPNVWKTMNSGTPEQAAQTFLSGYLKPAEPFRLARTAAYARGVPDLEHYVGDANAFPADMAKDDQLAGLVSQTKGPAVPGADVSAEDKLSAAMMGGPAPAPIAANSQGGTSMVGPAITPVMQQKAAALASLYNEAPGYKQLADSLMAAGQAMGQTAHSPWQALGSIAQTASGMWNRESADEAQRNYVSRLAAALQGSGVNPSDALIATGDPDLIKAGIQARIAPKEFKLAPGERQFNAAGQVIADNNQPKPPEGYLADPNKPGALSAIPGGPADINTIKQVNAAKGHEYNSSEMKAIEDAQNKINAAENLSDSLHRALDYSKKVAGGWGSETGAWIRNNTIPSENSEALANMNNEVMNSMLPSMKTIFPSRVTNVDVALLKELQGLSSQPQNIRQTTLERALARAEALKAQTAAELEALRNKTFFKPGGGQTPSVMDSPLISGAGNTKPDQPAQSLDPLAQARAAIAAGAPRDAVIDRLKQNGIDSSGL